MWRCPTDVRARVRMLRSRDEDPADLAAQLWDLPSWAREGDRLLAEMAEAPDVPGRFVVAAAIVRHLLTDPVLPARAAAGALARGTAPVGLPGFRRRTGRAA